VESESDAGGAAAASFMSPSALILLHLPRRGAGGVRVCDPRVHPDHGDRPCPAFQGACMGKARASRPPYTSVCVRPACHACTCHAPPQSNLDAIRTHVTRIASLVARKGHVKTKRLRDLQAALAAADSSSGSGGAAAASEAKLRGDRSLVTLSGLSVGENPGKALRCKALAPVAKSDAPPATLIVLDAAGEAIAVSVYFLREAQAAAYVDRDTILILDPVLRSITVDIAALDTILDGAPAASTSSSSGSVSYQCIQVHSRATFVVNGKLMDSSSSSSAAAASGADAAGAASTMVVSATA
jgi:hypothetical protein